MSGDRPNLYTRPAWYGYLNRPDTAWARLLRWFR